MRPETILILDFGSQYAQLIARRVRECHVYGEIVSHDIRPSDIEALAPKGLILSGGPSSVQDLGAPLPHPGIFEMGLPILGICYGVQSMAHLLGGQVQGSRQREYGPAWLSLRSECPLFEGLPERTEVWMSHGDRVTRIPPGFEVTATSENGLIGAIADRARRLFGTQFHPEVVHTPLGRTMLQNFLIRVCNCSGSWTMEDFVTSEIQEIRDKVRDERVLCGISGGVDSAVAAVLCHRAIGDRLDAVFVDNGLLRQGEVDEVRGFLEPLGLALHVKDAASLFLEGLRGLVDPEEKRKTIGRIFIEVFEAEAQRLGRPAFLAQGTLYPDVIESRSPRGGPSAKIKSHHNVGGLPERLGFQLIEPLRTLFKDEVRELGRVLGIPEPLLQRHPFPGPGLAVRIVGEVTPERLAVLRKADAIVRELVNNARLEFEVWQAFAVLLPVKSVGVMGDERTYENAAVLRVVTSEDGMTADWAKLPHDLLARISSRLVNEVRGINRVVYDITTKPPGTIEWE